jgi:orotidine-5'-phosphate decarboxylase
MKNISNSRPEDRLIFALDTSKPEEAISWIDLLSGHVGMFKVGLELFTAAGPEIVQNIKQRGSRVFLDLKFHDIPNTVARAAEAAVGLHVDMFNVHAAGGSRMIRETADAVAARAAKLGIEGPALLAVTVLTSLDSSDLAEIGFHQTSNDLVLRLAKLTQKAGASGVVASGQDIALLRREMGNDFLIVTPGIRSFAQTGGDDQKRTLSALEAISAGADYIVVGRPIRQAEKPLEACRRMVAEIADGLAARSKA